MRILVTGGAGYIGSHTVVELLEAGYKVEVVDNLCNSHRESIDRIEKITGKKVGFHRLDIRDVDSMIKVMKERDFDAVIHFAALKSVAESLEMPAEYYSNNVLGTMTLMTAMRVAGIKTMVFSSSATVYGDPESVPINEEARLGPVNPYGQTKLQVEEMMKATSKAEHGWKMVILRYFNPAGAHPAGEIGEDPQGIPNNLMPYICRVATGNLPELRVFGDDWPTSDGTGIRDYIHVVDLARGHIMALEKLFNYKGFQSSPDIYNLGTGRGYSVLEVVKAFEKAAAVNIPWVVVPRRSGDVAECWADPARAEEELGWRAELGLEQMCADAWKWQKANPEGYVPRTEHCAEAKNGGKTGV